MVYHHYHHNIKGNVITCHIKLLLNIMANVHIKTHHSMVCDSYI